MPSSIIAYAVAEMAKDWAITAVASFMLETSIATVAAVIGGATDLAGPTRLFPVERKSA
jgi:hypothetical protein